MAVFGSVVGVVFIGLSMIGYADRQSPSCSILNHFVSELGWVRIARGAWLFNVGIIVAGFAWIPLLWDLGCGIGTVLGRVAGVCGVSTAMAGILVGMVPMDHIVPHLVIAGVYFSTLPATLVVLDLAFIFSGKQREARWMLWASGVVLVVWLGFIVCPKRLLIDFLHNQNAFVRPAFWGLALLEWMLVLTTGLWMVAGAAYVVRHPAAHATGAAIRRDPTDVSSSKRWRRWLIELLALQLVAFLVYPMLICGCHFHAIAVPIGLLPAAWAGYTLIAHRTLGERLVSCVNLGLAIGWLYLAWVSNIVFAFR